SLVLFVSMLRDSQGNPRLTKNVVAELCGASPVPVYGVAEHHLDQGLLGGAMMNYASHGREIGAIAVARLEGLNPPLNETFASPLLINWKSLQKWRVPPSLVPEEAILRFKPTSVWQDHRGLILSFLGMALVQTVLIVWLLVNRATRRRAEN